MTDEFRIGDAAAKLGIETHVLRHWEDMGLLHPARSASGHRIYDDELVTRARLIRICQRAGMSLEEVRAVGLAEHSRRAELIRSKQADIRRQIERLRSADAFLAHLLTCSHPVASECRDCSEFAAAA